MKGTKIPLYLVLIILGIFALGFCINGIVGIVNYNKDFDKFKSSAVSTQATITNISSYSGKGGGYAAVTFKFNDGKGDEYHSTTDRSFDGASEGKTITVYYNEDDPEKTMIEPDVYLKREKTGTVFMAVIGVAMIAAGIIVYRKNRL